MWNLDKLFWHETWIGTSCDHFGHCGSTFAPLGIDLWLAWFLGFVLIITTLWFFLEHQYWTAFRDKYRSYTSDDNELHMLRAYSSREALARVTSLESYKQEFARAKKNEEFILKHPFMRGQLGEPRGLADVELLVERLTPEALERLKTQDAVDHALRLIRDVDWLRENDVKTH